MHEKPLEAYRTKKDSSLAMLLAAQRAGWSLLYFRQQDLSVRNGAPWGHGSWISVRDDGERWFEIGKPWIGGLEQMDALLMRKDPPFDMEYIYTTYILELAEARGVLVANKPASLRDINEKAYTSWFPQCTPPSLVTRSRSALHEFLKEHGKIVLKPFDGMGGRSIFVVAAGDLNVNVIIETLTDNGAKFTLAQRYIPEIVDGDKWARLEPHFGFKLTFSIDFRHPAVDVTEQQVEVDPLGHILPKKVHQVSLIKFIVGQGLGGSQGPFQRLP